MATKSPARQSDSKKKNFVVLSTNEDDETYVARLFDEENFTLSTDVNGWLLINAGSGKAADFLKLIWSVIVVEPNDDEKIEDARRREMGRFSDLLGARKHFGIEEVMELVNDMTEVSAGNDQ